MTADDVIVAKPSDEIAVGAVLRAEPAHPWVSRGGVKLAAALDHFRFDPVGLRLPRRRRLDRRLHRSAARTRRAARLRGRCRTRPAACEPARAAGDRLDRRDRHPRARSGAPLRAARASSRSTSASSRSSSCCRRRLRSRRRPAQRVGADQAAIRGRPACAQEGIVRDPPSTRRSATTSPLSSRRSAGTWLASSPRRSPAATATANSSSAASPRLNADRPSSRHRIRYGARHDMPGTIAAVGDARRSRHLARRDRRDDRSSRCRSR